MAKTYPLPVRTLPASSAVVSILIGDDTALGYGSEAAQVRTWPSTDTSLTYGKLWNGSALVPITRALGATTDDVGLEYPIAVAMEKRYATSTVKNTTPDCVIIKYATAEAVASPAGTLAKSWHPVAGAGSALDTFTTSLTAALVALRAAYDEVAIETIYISLGLADAMAGGTGESFASNVRALYETVRAATSNSARVRFILTPLCDRVTYPNMAVVREVGEYTGLVAIDADGFERGGLGAGSTPLDEVLSGQGIIDLGAALTAQEPDYLVSIK